MFLPSMKVAVKSFEGSPSDYPQAFEKVFQWIEEKGYKPYGDRMEKIKKRQKKGGKFRIKSQVRVPVKVPKKK